jgi:hypothetical protein
MRENSASRGHPDLKQLVAEASRALSLLDANRLEELALSCQMLNRDLATSAVRDRVRLARQALDASEDMAAFSMVIDVTRNNLNVINRLREQRTGRLEYGERQARGWTPGESGHGDN